MDRRARLAGLLFGTFLVFAAGCAPDNRKNLSRQPDGVLVALPQGSLKLDVRADNVIHVAYAKDQVFFSRKSIVAEPRKQENVSFDLAVNRHDATLSTSKMKARVDLDSGNVAFLDPSGKPILAERERVVTPAEVQGEQTQHVRQQWVADSDESLYGLGQHQLGILDLKGIDLDLWQRNTNVVVPFLVSTRGWGVLWDNPSFTRFGDLREFEPIPAQNLIDESGKPGGLTRGDTVTADLSRPRTGGRAGGGRPAAMQWQGKLLAPVTGDFQFQTYSNGGIKLWIDDKLLIDHWRQSWLAEYDQVKVHLEAGKTYPIRLESGGDQVNTMHMLWKTPAAQVEHDSISLWSEVADGIDYTFVYGPRLDDVVAGYRQVTGQAPMMPKWAFGLWQSRQRYQTSQQLTEALDGFRSRLIPIDNIVQDWMYWPMDAWGTHQFDPQRFPDPAAWIKSIHDKHARLMISVWGKFYPDTDNFRAMQKAGYIYQPTLDANLRDWVGRGYPFTFYDAFNPGARKLFWDQIDSALFNKGVDAWWMDATEPDVVQPSPPTLELTKKYIGTTAQGTASRVLNAYPLFNSQAVYEGQRAAAPDQRIFILTRSGFAGIQKYATATWSGDITSTWTALAKQIPAGLGFSISGTPYWTMDTGGYTMESRFSARNQTPENADEWKELNTRWFQFGTFTPLLRVHGELKDREMWTLGGEMDPAYQTELKFDRLRYVMLPYIYSLAGDITRHSGTMMRPLAMDFPDDKAARQIVDEYMFGPAFLVAPVTTYKARSRTVYLPKSAGWYDFWTGKAAEAGQTIDAPAPYESMPLYVKAGSIIPMGPELQYTDEKAADPTTLYVYTGADGAFTLYEDEGVNYNYEKGAFTKIPIRWNDATKTLSIGKREGAFPGMLKERTINVVIISKDKPAGFTFGQQFARTLHYTGDAIEMPIQ